MKYKQILGITCKKFKVLLFLLTLGFIFFYKNFPVIFFNYIYISIGHIMLST